jgi:hypothetical protein
MPNNLGGVRAAVTLVRASAAELVEQVAGVLSRWVDRSGLDDSRVVGVVLGVALDPGDASAMRQAAEAAVADHINIRIRWWLSERPFPPEFHEVRGLCCEHNAWAAAKGLPTLSENMLSRRLIKLGFEQRDNPKTRRSEFWLVIAEGRNAL